MYIISKVFYLDSNLLKKKFQYPPILYAFFITTVVLMTVCPLHIGLSFYDTDFLDYCTSVASFSEEQLEHPFKRSKFAGIIPYIFSIPFGLINGIALTSICSFLIITLVMYYYMKDFLSPKIQQHHMMISLSFVLFTIGPIGALLRSFNYYPEIIAVTFTSTWLTSRSLFVPTTKHIFYCALSIVVVLCIDPRGILWGLPNLFFMCMVVFWSKKILQNIVIILAVLVLGWFLGGMIYSHSTMSLAEQLDVRPLYYHLEPTNPLYAPPHLRQKGFVWGIGSFENLTYEIRFLYEQLQLPAPKRFQSSFPNSEEIDGYWWLCNLLLLGSLVYLLHSFQHHKKFLALTLPLVPYIIIFYATPNLVEPHIRFFSQSLVGYGIIYALTYCLLSVNQDVKTRCAFASLIFGVHHMLEPEWNISRAMMFAEISNSQISNADMLQNLPIQYGQQVHLMVLPLTKNQKQEMSTWSMFCRRQLHDDDVSVPFYTTFLSK